MQQKIFRRAYARGPWKDLVYNGSIKSRQAALRSIKASKAKFDMVHDVEFTDEIEEKTEDQLEEHLTEKVDDGVEVLLFVVPTTIADARLLQRLLQPSHSIENLILDKRRNGHKRDR